MTDNRPPARPSSPTARSFDPSRLAILIKQQDDGNVMAAARRAKIAQPTLHNILKGLYKPRADTLAKLAKAYGVSFDYISGRDERTEDDTFVSGARAAIRALRRELDRLDDAIDADELGPRARPADRPAPAAERLPGDLPPADHPVRGVPKAAGRGERATKPKPILSLQKRRGKRA